MTGIEFKNHFKIEYYRNYLKQLKSERAKISGGYITKDGGQYNEKIGNVKHGISRDKNRVSELMRAKFLDLKIFQIEEYLSKIEQIEIISNKIHEPVNYIQNRFNLSGYDLGNIIWNDFQKQCIGHQSENPFRREELKLQTNNGVKVRSLSEQIIGNTYESFNIPYLYEKRLTVDVTDMPDVIGARHYNGRLVKDYYPDFTILLANFTFKYHEHLGLINKLEYIKSNGEKIIACTNAGLITSDQLILTYPKDIYDTSSFIKRIKETVLPYV